MTSIKVIYIRRLILDEMLRPYLDLIAITNSFKKRNIVRFCEWNYDYEIIWKQFKKKLNVFISRHRNWIINYICLFNSAFLFYFVLGIQHHVRRWQKLCLFFFSIQCVTRYQCRVIQTMIDLSSVKAMQLQFFMQVLPINNYIVLLKTLVWYY